jgi:hypothetical protein
MVSIDTEFSGCRRKKIGLMRSAKQLSDILKGDIPKIHQQPMRLSLHACMQVGS